MTVSETDKILIVGAGCFGISTAYHLLKRGFKDVTILDRSEVHPAPDAASTDLNKSTPVFLPPSVLNNSNICVTYDLLMQSSGPHTRIASIHASPRMLFVYGKLKNGAIRTTSE